MKTDMIIGSILIIASILITIFGVVAPLATYYNNNPGLPVVYMFGWIDEGDYYNEIFLDPFPYWDQEYINVAITGYPSEEDMMYCTEIFNEWNTLGNVPIIIMDKNRPTDLEINFDLYENEPWAGGTWIKTVNDENKIITYSHIAIRQSWPYCRENVIRHEFGHAMGLAYHSNHISSSIYNYANVYSSYWSDEDLQVIHSIYDSK